MMQTLTFLALITMTDAQEPVKEQVKICITQTHVIINGETFKDEMTIERKDTDNAKDRIYYGPRGHYVRIVEANGKHVIFTGFPKIGTVVIKEIE